MTFSLPLPSLLLKIPNIAEQHSKQNAVLTGTLLSALPTLRTITNAFQLNRGMQTWNKQNFKPLPSSTSAIQTIDFSLKNPLTTHLFSFSLQSTATFTYRPNRTAPFTLAILTSNHITLPTTNQKEDQSITTFF